MSSLLKAFKEFYNEINGATLTGAIDVIVVEQADGTFVCSPFHVRFGKLGVLRCREKIVDIEVNGEPVNIHMKLGESGEAFFVQECHEHDLEKLPANLTTSPLPSEEFTAKYDDRSDIDGSESIEVKLRRNSIVGSLNDKGKIYENQTSDYTTRRYSEKVLNRRSQNETKVEYTTEQIRMELGDKEALFKPNLISNIGSDTVGETSGKPHSDIGQLPDVVDESKAADVLPNEENQNIQKLDYDNTDCDTNADNNGDNANEASRLTEGRNDENVDEQADNTKGSLETKSKKRRRKRSMMKKKSTLPSSGSASNAASVSTSISNTPRKNSSSSSLGSMSAVPSEHNDMEIGSNMGIDTTLQSSNAASISTDDFAKSDVANTANDDSSYTVDVQDTLNTPRMRDFHFFSDTEAAASPYGSRPSTPIQSDSEFEISQRDSLIKNEKNSDPMTSSTASWKWGELPITPAKADLDTTPMNKEAKQAERNSSLSTMLSFMKETMKKRKSTSEGVYLSDLLDTDCLPPEIVDKYFPPRKESFGHMHEGDDRESGNGTSIPQSPNSIGNCPTKRIEFDFDGGAQFFDKNIMALSLCGGLERGGPTDDEFNQNIIDFADVSQNPSIFGSPLLVVRLCDKYHTWSTACAIVMTALIFRKPLPNSTIEQMSTNRSHGAEGGSMKPSEGDNESEHKNSDRRNNTGGYSWWKWRRSTDSQEKKLPLKDTDDEKQTIDGGVEAESKQSTFDYLDAIKDVELNDEKPADDSEFISTDYQVQDISSDTISAAQLDDGDKHDDSITAELDVANKKPITSEKYRKTLRLTSEQIESLNLKPGMNELEFSVTTAYQGTSRCKCYVFRWRHTDKVVISDIDGTITKSDVLGHILPMVGKDWAQLGVAELFTKIEKNGYKLLYLSARAIGQSRATRDYLRSIQQGNVKLPDGPLLLNPTSLISAFHREVIEKKPEEFKIACLSDIKALFPENPFYAGYGNRINDVWAYCAVGIPVIRIFTINPKGELKHELNKTFQSTYHNMAYIVDQYFPPINDREESVEFSSFNYWREPILDIESNCDDLIGLNTSTSSSNLSRMQQTSPVPVSDDLSTIVEKA